MYSSRGPNGKNKETEKDKGDCFKEKGRKETNYPMKEASKEKGGFGFAMISSWFWKK